MPAGPARAPVTASAPATAVAAVATGGRKHSGGGGVPACAASPAGPTGPASAAIAPVTTDTANTARRSRGPRGTGGAHGAVRAGPTHAPCPTVAEQHRVATGSADSTAHTCAADSTGPAGPAVAQQPAAAAAHPAGPAAGPTHTPSTPGADQAGRSPGPAGLAGRAGSAVAAVAPQEPPGTTGGSGSRQSIGAIADQRTPQQRVGGRVDHRQHLLLRGLQRRSIGRFGGRVGAARSGQGPQKLVVKRRRLGTDRLVSLAMAGKQRRNRDRHLIIGSGHHPGRRPHGRGVGRADR